jgi:biopolymer transport protein TolR
MGGPARKGRVRHVKKIVLDQPKSDINVTPLVDICLVLLIIFMVITPMMSRGKEVSLPKTEFHYSRKDKMQPVVGIDKDGILYYEKIRLGEISPNTIAQLQESIKGGWEKVKDLESQNRVYLKADESLAYAKVYPILMAINDMGVTSIDLGTNEQQAEAK